MNYSNFHTHTLYCDGRDSVRELVEKAIALGCPKIGFSGHSYTETGDAEPYCMSLENTKKYRADVRAAQKEYAGKIRIYLGIEKDYFSKDPWDDYDYSIGSVHYVYKDGLYHSVDESKDSQMQIVRDYFGGDYYSFIEAYYALVGDIYNKTDCDIVGHFDLVTKFNEKGDLFDVNHPRYKAAAGQALEKLMNLGLFFEVNYGAVAGGYKSAPYPAPDILGRLLENNEKILDSSDCHNKEFLLFGIGRENAFLD